MHTHTHTLQVKQNITKVFGIYPLGSLSVSYMVFKIKMSLGAH